MNNLAGFFRAILRGKENLTAAPKGSDFEENIKRYLKRFGFSEQPKDMVDSNLAVFLAKIKPKIKAKIDTPICQNELFLCDPNRKDYANFFIWQPHGSQDFPDFLVFSEKCVIAVEAKFSTDKQVKPMWNSNIPKENSIYIFASHGLRDLTIFLGDDVIERGERERLLNFWDKTSEQYDIWQREFDESIARGEFGNNFGFSVYVRRAYDQRQNVNKNAILDFFANERRGILEQNVLDFLESLE